MHWLSVINISQYTYIRFHRTLENSAPHSLGVRNLTLYSWCEQIATAMEYLAEKQVSS